MEHMFESSKFKKPHGQEISAEHFSFDSIIHQFEVGKQLLADSGLPELRPFDVRSISENVDYITQISDTKGIIGKEEYVQARNKLWKDLDTGRIEAAEFDEKLLILGVVRRALQRRDSVDTAALFAAVGLGKTNK